ncbi:MAG: hypothetical protein BWK75_01355 [Candidatus Altiarchaeales archaeon A3]|nr:MAG: hypothetical protein BWK75_01355 [Candidatus Altiarchaeales archaeon A3]
MESDIKTKVDKKNEDNEKFQDWVVDHEYSGNKEEMFITTEITENGTKYKMFKKISELSL